MYDPYILSKRGDPHQLNSFYIFQVVAKLVGLVVNFLGSHATLVDVL
ncbi:24335_t:CDS:2, partial [Racocetra persica]